MSLRLRRFPARENRHGQVRFGIRNGVHAAKITPPRRTGMRPGPSGQLPGDGGAVTLDQAYRYMPLFTASAKKNRLNEIKESRTICFRNSPE